MHDKEPDLQRHLAQVLDADHQVLNHPKLIAVCRQKALELKEEAVPWQSSQHLRLVDVGFDMHGKRGHQYRQYLRKHYVVSDKVFI